MSLLTFESSAGPRTITLADGGGAGGSYVDRTMQILAGAQVRVSVTLDAGTASMQVVFASADLLRISTLSPTSAQFHALRDLVRAGNDAAGKPLTEDQVSEGTARVLHRFGAMNERLVEGDTELHGSTAELRVPLGTVIARAGDTLVVRDGQQFVIPTPTPRISAAAASPSTTDPE